MPRFARLLALIAVLGLCSARALSAQDASAAAPQISDAKLAVFADAYLRVARLQEDYQAKMAAAHEPQAKLDLRRQQEEEFQKILLAEKTTAEEYRAALNVLAVDDAQRSKFDKIVETLRNQSPTPKAGG